MSKLQLFLSRLDPQLQALFFISQKEKLGLLFVLLVVSEQLIQFFFSKCGLVLSRWLALNSISSVR